MSGERHLELLGLLALVLICAIFIIASGASAEEGDEGTDSLIEELNANQNINGSWDDEDDGIEITSLATFTNSVSAKVVEFDSVVYSGMNWTVENYPQDSPNPSSPGIIDCCDVSTQTQAFIVMTDFETDEERLYDFQEEVKDEMLADQEPDGSWNDDVGDTSMAIYALITTDDEDNEPIENGIEWIQEQENEEEHSWGSIEDDSKAILALDSAGIDVWEEMAALMLRQKPDGSFGGVEETSWAVIALSTHPNIETMDSMDRAMRWLKSQNYDNNRDLAIAALAEQYYQNAVASWEQDDNEGDGTLEKKGGGSGFIPPPWLFALSFFIICSLALSYWLFARLDRNEILGGIRKDIYAYIAEHPGEHLANITKKFDLSSSSARYHLSVLEGMDRIVSHKNGKYKRFYVNKNGYSKYTNGNGYKHIMSALKNNTARKIVKFLISHPEANQKRVSNALKIHPSTVNWHAKRLRDAEIISKQKKGKEIVYSLNSDVQLKKVIGLIEGSCA